MSKVEATMMSNGKCELRYHDKDDSHMGFFWHQDIYDFIGDREYVVIDRLFTKKEFRNQGQATELLNKFCEENKNKVIIVIASVLKDEYPEEPAGEEFIKILNRFDDFFFKRNFSNFNTYSKTYEFREAFIYTKTEQGQAVFNAIKEYYDKGVK